MPDDFYRVSDDAASFYGKDYWLKHVKEDYGFPDVFERSRSDLPERCTYWIRDILKYKLPPAKTLELGCAHGGLVYLMKLAGYDATGNEMSQWICDYANKTFNIPMLCGRIEDLDIAPKTYDIILLMDVLEHMTDPVGGLKLITDILKDDGIAVIQTPCWRETEKSYEQMKEEKSIFMEQLKEQEHLYLFNDASLTRILHETGFPHIAIEPQIFPYDIFVFAGKKPLVKIEQSVIDTELQKTPERRVVLALMDVYSQITHRDELLAECQADRAARLEVIHRQNAQLAELSCKYHVIEEAAKQSCEELYKAKRDLSHLAKIFHTQKIDFGTDEASLFLRSGWSYNETLPDKGLTYNWALGKSASLFLALPKDQTVQLTVNIRSLQFTEPQTIAVVVDGNKIGVWRLSGHEDLKKYSIVIAPDEKRLDVSLVEFVFSQYLVHQAEPRQLAVLFESLTTSE
jgi:2-polyprenyl-3-methyl-5-hydroxy-6-metoxy-1,4-benzoquinol methylase